MDLNNFFSEESIIMDCQSKSKKNVLELISKIASSMSATNQRYCF